MEDLETQHPDDVIPETPPPGKRRREDNHGRNNTDKKHKGLEFESAIMILQTSTQQLQDSLRLIGPPPHQEQPPKNWSTPRTQLAEEIAKNAQNIRTLIQKAIDLAFNTEEPSHPKQRSGWL